MRIITRVNVCITAVKNQAVFSLDLNLICSNHQASHTTDSQFTTGCQRECTTDAHLHCTADRNRMVTTDVSGISTTHVNSICTAHVIRAGCRDIHGIGSTIYPAEGTADNNRIRQTNNTGGRTDDILGEVSTHNLAAVSPDHTALVHPDRFTAVNTDSRVRAHTDSLGMIDPDKLSFVQFGHTGHISFRLLPILFQPRFVIKTDTVVVGFTAADGTAD